MPTVQEHLDNLDRMIDTGAHKPQVVEQIEIIRRVIALNDAEFSNLASAHSKLQEEYNSSIAALQENHRAEIAKIRAANTRPSDGISPKTREILLYLFKTAREVSEREIGQKFQLEKSVAGYHLDELWKKKFITGNPVITVGGFGPEREAPSPKYEITGEGRKYIVENGLNG